MYVSCDKTIVTYDSEVENFTAHNANYNIKNNVTCKWNEQLREQYTLAFNIDSDIPACVPGTTIKFITNYIKGRKAKVTI